MLEINVGGSGIIRGATETEQGFRVDVCGFERAVMDPEVEDGEPGGMVADTTELPQADALVMEAEDSGVVSIFRDPSVTQ